jgi:hypothetical protein
MPKRGSFTAITVRRSERSPGWDVALGTFDLLLRSSFVRRCGKLNLDLMTTSFSNDETGLGNRISPRHMFETNIRIRLQRDSQTLTLQGWVRNLSESGLGAFVAEALTLGESVTLEVPLPDSDKQVIPAKVVRALGTEYGFQFTALSAEQRTRIRATLKGRQPIPYRGTGR